MTPPTPPGLTHVFQFANDPLRHTPRWAAEHGDVVRLRVPGIPTYLVSDPGLIDQVLVRDARHYRKDRMTRMLSESLGMGLVTSEGQLWRRQRRLANPAFQHRRIRSYAAAMVEITEQMLDGWSSRDRRDLHADMMRLTLAVATRTLFGADLDHRAKEIGGILEALMTNFAGLKLPIGLPTPSNLRARRAVRRLDEVLYELIATKRDPEARGLELLSMLADAVDDEGVGMSEQQLRDEAATLLTAGHETTASALSFTFMLLAQHPTAEARLHAELDEVLEGAPPRFEQLRSLRYTNALLKESMRLYPPVWGLGREPLQQVELGGYTLPPGAQIAMLQWVVHRDARFYDDPLVFRPERWLDGSTDDLPRQSWFPFGAGPRACIGKRFAWMEAVLLTATMAQQVAIRLQPGPPMELLPSVTLRPAGGLPVVVERRATRRAA